MENITFEFLKKEYNFTPWYSKEFIEYYNIALTKEALKEELENMDYIYEFADSKVPIRTNQRIKWLSKNDNYFLINEVVQEYWIDYKNFDLIKVIWIAMEEEIIEELYNELNTILEYLED